MLIRLVVGAVAVGMLAASAWGADAITTPQSCFAMVDALSQSYQNRLYDKKIDKSRSNQIGDALAALEKQCESNQLTEAQRSAEALKALINQ